MQKKVKLSPPWVLRCKMLEALFSKDPEVNVVYLGEGNINVAVCKNEKKYNALKELLPQTMDEGYTTITVEFLEDKGVDNKQRNIDLFKDAFANNTNVNKVYSLESPTGVPMYFVEFKSAPVQFYADNIGDPNGSETMLLQDIAKELFKGTGVCMYTEVISAPTFEFPF